MLTYQSTRQHPQLNSQDLTDTHNTTEQPTTILDNTTRTAKPCRQQCHNSSQHGQQTRTHNRPQQPTNSHNDHPTDPTKQPQQLHRPHKQPTTATN
ncbi:hypothetical protein OS493_028160 [Desmophyllum pertusum]|uniref:Uncharacterized protein n=1 Tax=Desmophyllum pertusum TaxID=174260 RepID=A0A9W9ZA06_9CNID|nr:hypothetical protein OS493_028160 [Desmophyllum pertusum]